jgi:AraC-like DNA-binding protein
MALSRAEDVGLSREEFSLSTGISAADLLPHNGRIDGERHKRLVELLASFDHPSNPVVPDNENLFPDFPTLGNLCLNAPTLRDALKAFAVFRPLIGEFDSLTVTEAPEVIRFEYLAEFAPSSDFQACANFQVLANLVRAYEGGATAALQVTFRGPQTAHKRSFSDAFESNVHCGSEVNSLCCSSVALDAPASSHNSRLAPFLLQQAQAELRAVQSTRLLSARVECLITELLRSAASRGFQTRVLSDVCRRLNTSRWTLHRRLKAEGVSFTELEARTRFNEAKRLLGETELTVGQVSEQLGFASQSAFTRFFRSRHEYAPSRYRQASRSTG